MLRIITRYQTKSLLIILLFTLIVSLLSCAKKQDKDTEEKNKAPVNQTVKDTLPNPIITITSEEQFKTIIDSSGEQLLVIDFYADWCMPCKMLSPRILEIARENKGKASFYKLDVDKHRKIAAQYRVMGIPYIVFIKNKEVVHTITGISPKELYIKAIVKFSQSS